MTGIEPETFTGVQGYSSFAILGCTLYFTGVSLVSAETYDSAETMIIEVEA